LLIIVLVIVYERVGPVQFWIDPLFFVIRNDCPFILLGGSLAGYWKENLLLQLLLLIVLLS